jgi:hypothetical protein
VPAVYWNLPAAAYVTPIFQGALFGLADQGGHRRKH